MYGSPVPPLGTTEMAPVVPFLQITAVGVVTADKASAGSVIAFEASVAVHKLASVTVTV